MKMMILKDQRINLINEMLHSIRFIKYYNWEKYMKNKIDNSRKKEAGTYKNLRYLGATSVCLWTVIF